MLKLYVLTRTWATARWRAARSDDRGAVSVEQAIAIGLGAMAAVAVGTALIALVNKAIAQWQLW